MPSTLHACAAMPRAHCCDDITAGSSSLLFIGVMAASSAVLFGARVPP